MLFASWVELKNSGLFVFRANKLGDLFASLLGEKDSMNVGKDATRRNGDAAEQLVQFFVVLDGQGNVAGHNAALLVVSRGVASQLQDLGAQVLQDGSEVDGGASSHARGVLALTEVTTDTTDGELQTRLGGGGGALLVAAATLSFSFSRHGCCCLLVNERAKEADCLLRL